MTSRPSTDTSDGNISFSRRAAARRALELDPRSLLSTCEVEFFTAGGPGGQHRNKTASGVRLTHGPTEVSVTATERRSQSQNRSMALQRLLGALQLLAKEPTLRRKTRPTRQSKERRLEQKRRLSAKKNLRRGDV